MTGSQLRKWRIDQGLSLREVVDRLDKQVNHTSLSRWETEEEGTKEIPKWASDKLLGQTQITLPLDELHQLLDYGREKNIPSQELIATAIREWLQKQRPPQQEQSFTQREIQTTAGKATLISGGYPGTPPHLKVAEADAATSPTQEPGASIYAAMKKVGAQIDAAGGGAVKKSAG